MLEVSCLRLAVTKSTRCGVYCAHEIEQCVSKIYCVVCPFGFRFVWDDFIVCSGSDMLRPP